MLYLSVDCLPLQGVPALSEVTQRRDRARSLWPRGEPTHKAMVQTLHLDLLLVQLPLKLLMREWHNFDVISCDFWSDSLANQTEWSSWHLPCGVTLRSHSCCFTASKSAPTRNSSVDLSSADFSHSNSPCSRRKCHHKFLHLSRNPFIHSLVHFFNFSLFFIKSIIHCAFINSRSTYFRN